MLDVFSDERFLTGGLLGITLGIVLGLMLILVVSWAGWLDYRHFWQEKAMLNTVDGSNPLILLRTLRSILLDIKRSIHLEVVFQEVQRLRQDPELREFFASDVR